MKIGFGVTAYLKTLKLQSVDGIGQYTNNLFASLNQEQDTELQPCSFYKHHNDPSLGEVINLNSFKTQILLAQILRRSFFDEKKLIDRLDIYHATDHYIPKYRSIPVIATVHDTIPFDYPEWFTTLQRSYHAILNRSLYWPNHILTVSNYSKRTICKLLGTDPKNVSVVYNGLDEKWGLKANEDQLENIKKRHHLPNNFVLFVGTIQKRKNLTLLIKAYERMNQSDQATFSIVVVGRPSIHDKDELAFVQSLARSGKIIWLNYVPNNELRLIFKCARCLVFPSLAEGFGLPIIEAFASGTPVIASDCTSIPEITGDAAILVSPKDADQLKEKLRLVLSNDILRSKMIQRGKTQSLKFSWKNTAKETAKVYRMVLKNYRKKIE